MSDRNDLKSTATANRMPSECLNELISGVWDTRVPLRQKYLGKSQAPAQQYSVEAGEYLEYEDWARDAGLNCPESYPTDLPEAVSEIVSRHAAWPDGFDIQHTPVVGLHLAYGGATSPLHFDWDMSEVLHLNVYGERTVWVGVPRQNPLLPTMGNSVLADFELVPAAKRKELLRWFDLTPYHLKPGQYVRFPAHHWHLVEYESASMALSIRREVSSELRPLQCFSRSIPMQVWLEALLQQPLEVRVEQIAELINVSVAQGGLDTSTAGAIAVMEECCSTLSDTEAGISPWHVFNPANDDQIDSPREENITSRDSQELMELARKWLFSPYETAKISVTTQEEVVHQYLFR